MIKELQLRILPEEAVNEQSLRQVVARETGEAPKNIRAVRVLKRSIDARQRTIFVNVKLRVFMNEMPSEPEYQLIEYKDVSAGKPVIVVGAGPGRPCKPTCIRHVRRLALDRVRFAPHHRRAR